MNFQNSLALAVVVLLAPCALGASDRHYNSIESDNGGRQTIRCVSGSDCGASECSVMGMQRFSEPECRPRGELGAPCRMYADEPENKTLHFPHVTMECQDVYMQFCPCAAGLVCREAECSRAQSSVSYSSSSELETEDYDEAEWGQRVPSATPDYSPSANRNQDRRPFPWAMGRFH